MLIKVAGFLFCLATDVHRLTQMIQAGRILKQMADDYDLWLRAHWSCNWYR